jgi:hypothetical protein
MVETPRRRSKLAGEAFGEPLDQSPRSAGRNMPTDQQALPVGMAQTPPPSAGGQVASRPGAPPVTRNPRRLRVGERVSDDDLVSFNCKMTRGLRREVRYAAAEWECDIQDVVAAALAEYLTARGRHVPPSELRRPG